MVSALFEKATGRLFRAHADPSTGLFKRGLASRCRDALAKLLGGLPHRWLPVLAYVLAVWRCQAPSAARARAQAAVRLALGASRPQAWMDALLREAGRRRALDRLARLLPRSPWYLSARLSLATLAHAESSTCTLHLTAGLGWPGLLEHLGRRAGLPLVDLEAAPRTAADAGPLEWLGRATLVDLAPLRAALAAGREVRVLLLLPDPSGLPLAWQSPPLHPGPGGAREAARVAQQALDVLAVLARALPELVDWEARRWSLRPEPALLGHAPWSRLAPWLAAHPPRRPLRPAPRPRRPAVPGP